MERLEYVIVTEEMVWLFINEEYNARGFRELLGKDARQFIASQARPTVATASLSTRTWQPSE